MAFHNDKSKVAKFLKVLEIGELVHEQRNQKDVKFTKFYLIKNSLIRKLT